MEYISLGSNCSVTYQLEKLGLRNRAYPFDWVKVSLTQLIKILENDFYDYANTIEFKKNSSLHPLISEYKNNLELNTNSIIASNIYGIILAHELTSKYEIEELKNKIMSRIDRFKNLSLNVSKIKFVRIELNPLKFSWKNQIMHLISLLDKIIREYELVLIINKSVSTNDFINFFPLNIKIHQYENFSPDWKMDMLDWKSIFVD